MKRISWSALKSLIDAKKLRHQYYLDNGAYYVEIADGGLQLECIINKDDLDNPDVADFENNYMASANKPIEPSTTDLGATKVAIYKPEESSTTRCSHDWTDRCTWFSNATEVVGEVLTKAGSLHTSPSAFWIDVNHGRVYMEDNYQEYAVKVYDDGVELVEDTDYTVNYELGQIQLDNNYGTSGVITADYHYSGSSEFVLKPEAGKKIILEHAELQVAENVMMPSPIKFVIWVYNPYFNPANPIVEWFEGAQFGVDNFLHFPYKQIRYKNIRDIINGSNLGQGFIPKCAGLTQNVIIFPFNYITLQTLKSSQGAELRISIDDDIPMTGEWGTVTFYIISDTE